MDLFKFGKTLRIKRTEHGLSSAQAASKFSLSAAYYSRLENGKERPSQDLLTKIAQAYNLPIEDQRLLGQLSGYATGAESEGLNTAVPAESVPAVSIKLDAQKVPVLFSDSMFITISENGVVFDFAQKVASSAEQQIVTRVGVSPAHAQKIYNLLGDQLEQAKKLGLEN